MDVRRGGVWQVVHGDPDGDQYVFRRVYHDVVAPERIVQTFEFDGAAGHVALETLTISSSPTAEVSSCAVATLSCQTPVRAANL